MSAFRRTDAFNCRHGICLITDRRYGRCGHDVWGVASGVSRTAVVRLQSLPRISVNQYCYGVYGIRVVSDSALALPAYVDASPLGDVACLSGTADAFAAALDGAEFRSPAASWYQYAFLQNGASYVRWTGVGEFIVDGHGRTICYRRDEQASDESFQVYLLGQALSFALVAQGLEPIHATAVVVNGAAVAFMGSNAFGKSMLAASFLEAGFPLLTDDLLVLHHSSGATLAYPGPPRIKLFAKLASRLLAVPAAAPMHASTSKLIVPLEGRQSCAEAVPIRAIYSVAAPRETCRLDAAVIEPVSARDRFLELVRGTFNRRLVDAARLQRQLGVMATVADCVPVKRLRYRRTVEQLHHVRAAVLADLDVTA